jgi:transposase
MTTCAIAVPPSARFSDSCEEVGIAPSLFYLWQRDSSRMVRRPSRSWVVAKPTKPMRGQGPQIQVFEAKLQRKGSVLAELMEEHVALRKELGET